MQLEQYDSAVAELASAVCPARGLGLADDERQRLLAMVTNTLKQLCDRDSTAAAHKQTGSPSAAAAAIEGAGGGGASGAFLNTLIAFKVATTAHFNVW